MQSKIAHAAERKAFSVVLDKIIASASGEDREKNIDHLIDMAEKLKEIIREKGWEFYMDSPTNQQLILMTEDQMEALGKTIAFDRWGVYDSSRTIVRLATSWSTSEEDLDVLRNV